MLNISLCERHRLLGQDRYKLCWSSKSSSNFTIFRQTHFFFRTSKSSLPLAISGTKLDISFLSTWV